MINESDTTFLKSNDAMRVYLPMGSLMYIPWGYFPQPVFYFPGPRTVKIEPNFMHVLHVPYTTVEAADLPTIEALKAIKTLNEVHLAPLTTPMWTDRRKGFDELMTALIKAKEDPGRDLREE